MNFADGRSDRTTAVHWGQTGSLYVDLRIPAGRPLARGRQSLEMFEDDELLRLAAQKGFAGHILMEGNRCTWIRYVDYQPGTGRPDSGLLRLEGDTLYEEGDATSIVGSGYQEIYHRVGKTDRCSIALRALASSGPAGQRDAVLVVLDNRFLYARNRSVPLPPAKSLADLVKAAAGDRHKIHAYLDCEISLGTIDGTGVWRVDASTFPFREGQPLLGRASVRVGEDSASLEISSDTSSGRWGIVESSLPTADLARLILRGAGAR